MIKSFSTAQIAVNFLQTLNLHQKWPSACFKFIWRA
jgi:hypothetical protein